MKKIRTVVADIDGFIADFEGAFCEAFGSANRHLYNLTKRYPEIDKGLILEWVNDEENYKDLNPIFGGISLLMDLNSKGWDIVLVTARPSSLRKVTIDWLKTYNIPYTYLDTGATHKAELLNDFYGTVMDINLFIDDDVKNLQEVKKYFPEAVCLSWLQPWNQGYFPTAKYDTEKMKVMIDMGDGNWKWIWSRK